jgi:hypothetical protein
MILFDGIVQILRRANPHRIRAEEVEVASYTHPPERTMTRLKAVERDATRFSMTFQCLAEEEARCGLVAGSAEIRRYGTSFLVDGAVQEYPSAVHLYIVALASTTAGGQGAPS